MPQVSPEQLRQEIIGVLKELREALKPKAVVFDLDGVLVDSSERYAKCKEEAGNDRRKFWECFLSEKYMDLDKPREDVVKILRGYLVKRYRIIILTGRIRQTHAAKTRKQLRKWGIYYHEIVFREKGDYRKDHVYKLEELARLMERYMIEVVYDDSTKVLDAIKKRYPQVKVCKV
ncbi:MAG: hypothetical protein DRJ31_09450 [Candidatus Methanomethylicota archaeon]|uniref:Polynucleotide kinase PNKP phosphatase domain-containing protein n=1 Tax=Thermoproteota archaeon TaxID=2056631 RepID=A0A497EKQ2_9CREN|nr:MAG: hypothetical protein DRJ31_09450 [Candidatus Verstraetearchaeota archaeon]